MSCGGHPGTGVTIPVTGDHGEPITGTIITGTIITGMTITTRITATGTITVAGTTKLSIITMYVYTVQLWW